MPVADADCVVDDVCEVAVDAADWITEGGRVNNGHREQGWGSS